MHPSRRAIYTVVAGIPHGRVATYGQVAALAGVRGNARQVGYALAAIPESLDLPWHRVINARGGVSARKRTRLHDLQRQLLELEGIEFLGGMVDLGRFRWNPDPCPTC